MLVSLIKLIFKLFFFTGRIERGKAFLKPLSREEEICCFEKIESGDKSAEEKLVAHNLRLVAHVAKKYSKCGYDADELISVGSLGLLKAVRTYKLDNGNNFSTYASKCITNEILMLMRSDKKRVGDVSLESEIASDKDGNAVRVKDVIPSSHEALEDGVETSVLASNIVEIMKRELSDREFLVMDLRFGLSGKPPQTQSQIAKVLGISRSYISRIESHAISVVRAHVDDNFMH